MTEDLELLEAWRGGDRSAGSKLADRHFDRLWRFFRFRVESAVVPDLIQRTLLGVVESRDRPVRGGSFRAYLLGIARRIAQQYYAEHRRDQVVGGDSPINAAVADEDSPVSAIAQHEQQRLLLAALRTLPLDSQLVLELSFWEELTVAEIADVVGCAPGTVKSRVSRAKSALREAIAKLANSSELAISTSDDLDRWAHSIRWFLDRTAGEE